MSTYTQILYHIVFGTKDRKPTLLFENRENLYKYIRGILKNKKCVMYIANGTEDHIHILTHIHPTVSLSYVVKDIKLASTDWIKKNKIFKNFTGWQEGYGAFTCSIKEKDNIIEYISTQNEHHQKINRKEEYIQLLSQNGINYNHKYVL